MSTVSSTTRVRRGSTDSNSSDLSNTEISADPHFNSLLQVKQPQTQHLSHLPYQLDNDASEDLAATSVLLHSDFHQRDEATEHHRELKRQSTLNYSSANVVSPSDSSSGTRSAALQGDAYSFSKSSKRDRARGSETLPYEGSDPRTYKEKSFASDGTVAFTQKRASKLLEDDDEELSDLKKMVRMLFFNRFPYILTCIIIILEQKYESSPSFHDEILCNCNLEC